MEKLKVADAGRSKQQGEREMDKQKEYQNTRGNPPPTKHLSRPALWPSQPPGMRPFSPTCGSDVGDADSANPRHHSGRFQQFQFLMSSDLISIVIFQLIFKTVISLINAN